LLDPENLQFALAQRQASFSDRSEDCMANIVGTGLERSYQIQILIVPKFGREQDSDVRHSSGFELIAVQSEDGMMRLWEIVMKKEMPDWD
jgi:hypothetical protein